MPELATTAFRQIGRTEAIPNNFVVPYYLDDRKLRISIARVNHRLYAFDDLYTCTREACPLSGGLLVGTTIMCQCHGSRFDIATGAVIAPRRPSHSMCTRCRRLMAWFESERAFRQDTSRNGQYPGRPVGILVETMASQT